MSELVLYKKGDVVIIGGVSMTVKSDQTLVESPDGSVTPGPVTASYMVPAPQQGGIPGEVWGTYWPGQKVDYEGGETSVDITLLRAGDGVEKSDIDGFVLADLQKEINDAVEAEKAAKDAKTTALESELAEMKGQLASLLALMTPITDAKAAEPVELTKAPAKKAPAKAVAKVTE